MKIIIKHLNSLKGIYAVGIEQHGEYVIFELLDSVEPEAGDIISHPDFYSLGGETFKNLTQNCEIDVLIENICAKSQVKSQLFLTGT